MDVCYTISGYICRIVRERYWSIGGGFASVVGFGRGDVVASCSVVFRSDEITICIRRHI